MQHKPSGKLQLSAEPGPSPAARHRHAHRGLCCQPEPCMDSYFFNFKTLHLGLQVNFFLAGIHSFQSVCSTSGKGSDQPIKSVRWCPLACITTNPYYRQQDHTSPLFLGIDTFSGCLKFLTGKRQLHKNNLLAGKKTPHRTGKMQRTNELRAICGSH